MNEFGQRLKSALKSAGFTQAKATEELELSKNAITNYVGGRIPDAIILYKLSNLLGVSMEWLLTGEETQAAEKKEPQVAAPVLTREESEMIAKYKQLDCEGREDIRSLIQLKYDRLVKRGMLSNSKTDGTDEEAATNEAV